ncbi:Cytochrome c oxidase assembly protein COX11, mito chondrial [Trichuris trichiura]|uniref:Cytochrome c oxidase assembly protein COX11, mitochondrial n=1 Tax=Trichuris trichiura TaxID=36087 RepID=A0A077ZAW0_TRITR|nr:Cytochrome c oxidase assembly protein COX11, mito chondrial [Trichuris trichiura]
MFKSSAGIESMDVVRDTVIPIHFSSDSNIPWKLLPVQDEILIHPGETALTCYTAESHSTKRIIGIASYNVLPLEAGLYFVKIQCFCFEEQMINPGEVDLPVFFYLDPEYADDPRLEEVDDIVLHYTFFEAKTGLQLPQPIVAPPIVH